ncbi:MAG: hypothetical protein IKT22_07875 [Prevotella sp.]|nr:hypothetical protein [Prevotella sp.]
MKRITLILMALLTITTAFSQTTRSKGASIYPGSTSTRGDDWEVFEFGGNTYNYFKGNAAVDELTTGKLLGFHWKGNKYDEHIDEEIYLCNMQTGEYLQIGDLWGENGMTSHVGIPYKIIAGNSTRRAGWGGPLSDMTSDTYWIQPMGVRQERVIGRSAIGGSGAVDGHFEYNRHLFLRTQQEYHGDSEGVSTHPGGLLFKFQEYTVDGQTCYIIYTHRKTNGQTGNRVEFGNRDSYLLLTSVGATSTADFNNVRFEKFAGQMRGVATTANRGIKLTFNRTGSTKDDVAVTVTDMTGASISGVTATLHSMEFTGNADPALKTSGAAAITGGLVLAPNSYANNANAEINFTFKVSGLPATNHTFNAANIDVYSMNASGNKQTRMDRNFQFFMQTGDSDASLSAFGSTGNINLTRPGATPNEDDGLYHGVQNLTVSNSVTAGSDFYIKVTLKKIASDGCYAGIGEVTLHNTADNYVVNYDQIGDETEYDVDNISLADGLNAKKGNKNNLWKIVTRKERDRYRIVASDAKPVDVSSRIFNSKFNTSYIYNIAYENCNDTDGDGHWVANQTDLHPDYGWTWYNHDASTHPTTPHVHPWPTTPNENTKESTLDYRKGKEFHKVGTGRFWRFSERNATNNGYIGGHDNDMQEMNITRGVDANYCGSIYEGSANLQQTITGLRAGNYIVYVRGFFAPHDMEKYLKSGENYTFDGGVKADGFATTFIDGSHGTDTWYQEAVVSVDSETGEPTWRRSHDSYLFAWSRPDYKSDEDPGENVEVRRMLPSIYEGATPVANITTMSKNSLLTGVKYPYSPMNNRSDAEKNLIKDEHVFGFYNGGFFGFTKGAWTGNFIVPRTVSGAGRFFNAIDADVHPEAQNYRVGLPVYVGDDGKLTIGVDHTQMTSSISYTQVVKEQNKETGEWVETSRTNYTMPPSGNDEWICFDEFELLYLGKDEGELFIIDELNGNDNVGKVGGYDYICGNTGNKMSSGDSEYPYYKAEYVDAKSPLVTRQNNTKVLDIFDEFDIENLGKDIDTKIVKNLLIRRTLTKNGWNSIVLPVTLTRAQVEEGFGEGTKVSKLKGVQGRTLVYDALTWEDKDDPYMIGGMPYIIYPTEDPLIPAGAKFEREPFTIKVSTTLAGVAGLYFKSSQYDRNYEIDHELAGPVYFIPDVQISLKDVFADTDNSKSGTLQWISPASYGLEAKVRGDGRSFTLKETAYYEYPGTVPAYSYYYNKGQIRYATEAFNTSKGLLSIIQLTYKDGDTEVIYSKPFLDGDLDFYIDESETNGIDETYSLPDDPLNLDIYDLQGRKVETPQPGHIYIMNGKKLLWK